jgi:DNA (cytosine-5)-methyltransferase 1
MAGNATPPLLAEIIGRAMVHELLERDAEFSATPELVRRRKTRVPQPVEPVPVPARLRFVIGKKKAHPGAGLGPSPRDVD